MSASAAMNNRKKTSLRAMLIIVLAILVLPLTGYLYVSVTDQQAAIEQTNPRADTWRQVREGNKGYSAVRGQETNVLIQGAGQNWRQLRNGPIATYGAWLLSGVLVILAAFYLLRGEVKLNHPRTGKTVERWTLNERRLHWTTATLFILLAITGLSLLYGRFALIPLLGYPGFSAYATAAKWIHNVLGPVFMVALFIILIKWFKQNLFTKVDIQWFKDFGGMVGDKHPSAGKFNGGEKLWFWTLATAGVALCFSGLVLDFPNFGQERFVIIVAHLIHILTAMLLMAFSLGHIYIGTIGTEGALEGMTTGHVDVAWAEQHHDLWLKELEQQEQAPKH
ncbi:formate dehydrogenase subunit gamma [Methylophaga sp.]|uniref:formate dehydrogenase subunit gamma n=1 Tax=Methylophaga sp. TaxID=2024840 RepID=UPI0027263EC3|nr:formate dehydrogenase subunit gamma [Methylophaga sp.]MDO8828457.1 formate dehydrogenase subunit gamma [Methylophaga sp.]